MNGASALAGGTTKGIVGYRTAVVDTRMLSHRGYYSSFSYARAHFIVSIIGCQVFYRRLVVVPESGVNVFAKLVEHHVERTLVCEAFSRRERVQVHCFPHYAS
jgi:hypothetical protein